MEMRGVVDISEWIAVDEEPGGAEVKTWLAPRTGDDERWLFKPVRRGDKAVKGGGEPEVFLQGNPWAESIAYRLGIALGVPMAQAELARWGILEGSISRDVSPEGWSLHSGSVRLAEVAPEYVPRTSKDKRPDRVGHSLPRIFEALHGVAGPLGSPYEDWPAIDVFAAFLLLDALIANQDRHEENWAVLDGPDGELHLSPAFDHGSSLGAGMDDIARRRILDTDRVTRWCERGRALKIERAEGRVRRLVELASDAFDMCHPSNRRYWSARLTSLDLGHVDEVIATTPRMSEVARTLAGAVLRVNRERLLQCLARS
ncbi:HipA domain-containing protein [Ruania suaedae]|uniref:HipA domain-containing protein n=1 Tax=Ruania suaedae TaxID=2897774 RepID=UPI001E435EF9|nr:HipA domain-containing protein [Ruania suaedae]UFU02886.1 HipA domain-containing protein [Ruania suaedae]